MNILSKRLSLLEVTEKDIDFIHHLHSIPEVDEYNTLGLPADKATTAALVHPAIDDQKSKVRKQFGWVIHITSTASPIGMCGMFPSADKFKMAEIYYKLLPAYWGQGFATEAASALLKFGFDTLKLHRIEAGTAVKNKRSIKVLEKIGMTREGVRRKILPIRGEWEDGYHFAIVEDDPRI